MLSKRSYFWWSLTILYMLLIFYLSSLQRPIKYELVPGMDKILHLFECAILGCLLAVALKKSQMSAYFVIAWVIGSFYGVTDEIHQSFVPGRDASFVDIIADCLGSFIGAKSSNLFIIKKLCLKNNEGVCYGERKSN